MIDLFLILIVCFGDIRYGEKAGEVTNEEGLDAAGHMQLVQLGLCSNLGKHLTLRV
jgi:hypothetical protein